MKLGVYLLIAGIISYFLNIFLIRRYLNNNVPFLMDKNLRFSNGEYLWEQTAGRGIVPKWVSLIGLIALPLIGIGLLMIVISFFS